MHNDIEKVRWLNNVNENNKEEVAKTLKNYLEMDEFEKTRIAAADKFAQEHSLSKPEPVDYKCKEHKEIQILNVEASNYKEYGKKAAQSYEDIKASALTVNEKTEQATRLEKKQNLTTRQQDTARKTLARKNRQALKNMIATIKSTNRCVIITKKVYDFQLSHHKENVKEHKFLLENLKKDIEANLQLAKEANEEKLRDLISRIGDLIPKADIR